MASADIIQSCQTRKHSAVHAKPIKDQRKNTLADAGGEYC